MVEGGISIHWVDCESVRFLTRNLLCALPQDREAFIYMGLPALSFCETALRALPQRANVGEHWKAHVSFRLGNGVSVSEQTCPEEWMPYFEKLVEAVDQLHTAQLDDDHLTTLRQQVLYAGDPHKEEQIPKARRISRCEPEAVVKMNRLKGTLQSASTQMSQSKSFASFENVICLLEAQEE